MDQNSNVHLLRSSSISPKSPSPTGNQFLPDTPSPDIPDDISDISSVQEVLPESAKKVISFTDVSELSSHSNLPSSDFDFEEVVDAGGVVIPILENRESSKKHISNTKSRSNNIDSILEKHEKHEEDLKAKYIFTENLLFVDAGYLFWIRWQILRLSQFEISKII
jgi:hypothetical protein